MSNFNHYSCGKIVFLKNKAFQMKNTLAFILLSTSLSIMACNNSTSPKVVTVETTQNMNADPLPMAEEAFGKLTIEGMTCAIGCAATIEKNSRKQLALPQLPWTLKPKQLGWYTMQNT